MTDAAVLIGAILAPLLTYLTASQVRQSRILAEHRAEIEQAREREALLWGWARALVDQIYKLGGVPVEPPDYLADLFPPRKDPQK